jgi:hypothetical protein
LKLRFAALLATLVLFVAGSAFAQNGAFAPYVQGTITTAPGSPATGASYSVGAGIESSTKHLLLDANGTFNTAKVTSGTGSGYNGTITGQGYYKLFSHVLVGGGASVVVNTNGFTFGNFASTARNSANPFVGGGVQLGRFRSILTYQLPGKDAVAGQRLFQLNSELGITKHVRLTVPVAVNSIAGQYTATSVGGGVKFVF